MLSIAVCDDDIIVCNKVEDTITNTAKILGDNYLIDIYYDGDSLLKQIKKGTMYDLIFLDINMDKLNGIEFGKILRNELNDELTKIVFISSQKSLMEELFQIRPFDFIQKPITQERITKILLKVKELMIRDHRYFLYNEKTRTQKVYYKNIKYFESDKHKLKIYMKDSVLVFNGTMKKTINELDSSIFWRIHGSIVVNTEYIVKYEYDKVILSDGTELLISQAYRKKIRELRRLKRGQ